MLLGQEASCQSVLRLLDDQLLLRGSRGAEVWTFHYLDHSAGKRITLGKEAVLKKTVFIGYFSGAVSLGGKGPEK